MPKGAHFEFWNENDEEKKMDGKAAEKVLEKIAKNLGVLKKLLINQL